MSADSLQFEAISINLFIEYYIICEKCHVAMFFNLIGRAKSTDCRVIIDLSREKASPAPTPTIFFEIFVVNQEEGRQ